ncbi:hypothetical protein PISMIDRAFT_42168, partial [Pisolithus microcarpus 441]
KDFVCVVNVQHNCIDSGCAGSVHSTICQERSETTRTWTVIRHEPTPKFFLNVYSIHNYTHILAALPLSL